MKFFNFRAEQQNVTEWTETVILNNFSSKQCLIPHLDMILNETICSSCFWK